MICKGASREQWKKLIMIGLNLKSQWKSPQKFEELGIDFEALSFIGSTLFEVLKSPDLSVPALIKEDNCVEFNSSYQQFIYEYLFRQQELQSGWKPKVAFTYLTEDEEIYREKLCDLNNNINTLCEEIEHEDETNWFFKMRWYCWNNTKIM